MWGFGPLVGACLVIVLGWVAMVRLEIFFGSGCLWVVDSFLCLIVVCWFDWDVSLWWFIALVGKPPCRSGVMVLLLLVCCFLCLPCFWGYCGCLCFDVRCFVSFLVLRSSWRGWELAAMLLLSFECLVAVDLPSGADGWSAGCDCGISWSYSVTFFRPTEASNAFNWPNPRPRFFYC